MIYLNNAATSYPKPPCVERAVCRAVAAPPREAARGTMDGGDPVEECRRALAPLLGVKQPGRIFLNSGATESFNMVLRGLPLRGRPVVVTDAGHSALLRPLYALVGQENIVVAGVGAAGSLTPEALQAALPPGPACVAVNHCSNVTGDVQQDLAGLARVAHAAGAVFVVDASQSAGAMPLLAEEWGIDILVFTGHKALFGPTGTGGFYLRPGVGLEPAKWGGTGTEGNRVTLQEPERFEVGTQNLVGLAGLTAGAGFVEETGLKAISRQIDAAVASTRDALGRLPGVCLYGNRQRPHGPVLAFNVKGLSPADVGYILWHSYGIAVRTGHHCAPLMGAALGCPRGTVRASISYLTTADELAAFVAAVGEIAYGMEGAGL